MSDLTELTPVVTRYEGREVAARVRAVAVRQTQAAVVRWPLLTPAGDPQDLSGLLGSASSQSSAAGGAVVRARAREFLTDRGDWADLPCELAGEAPGEALVTLAGAATAAPGVYRVEVGVWAPPGHRFAGQLVAANEFWVLVEQGAWGDPQAPAGPPGVRELRLALRDSAPEDSYLNESLEWDAAEACHALVRAVRWYNETRPPAGPRYTTATFPHKEAWLTGAMSFLYEVAANSYRREEVQYSAAGVSLNDKDKARAYDAKAQALAADFRDWAHATKQRLNAEAAFGGVGLYRRRWR